MTNNDMEYMLDCLARWVLTHYKTRSEQEASLKRMGKRNGREFEKDLRRRMNAEVKKRREKAILEW